MKIIFWAVSGRTEEHEATRAVMKAVTKIDDNIRE
jgi:hypothetical protein